MSAWTAFGIGILIGGLIFDQLWRHIRRLELRLASLRRQIGYYTKADVDASWERIRHINFEPTVTELAAQGMPSEGPRRGCGSGASATASPVANGDAPKTQGNQHHVT